MLMKTLSSFGALALLAASALPATAQQSLTWTAGAVGIMTVDASSLRPEHYAGAGIGPEIPTVVAGLETEKEFTRVMLDNLLELDVEAARQEHLTVARRLVAEHPEIGALVLECTNMPPYRADIQHATGLPVFDITTLVTMVHDAVRDGLPPRPA